MSKTTSKGKKARCEMITYLCVNTYHTHTTEVMQAMLYIIYGYRHIWENWNTHTRTHWHHNHKSGQSLYPEHEREGKKENRI